MSELTERLKTAIADRYVIERELGQGGMATVYLAHDVKHDRKVALKVLRPELAAVIGAERFLQEIKVTANLQHSHILPLYDSGAAEGFLFYVMPYVEGENLRIKLEREKQLVVEEAVELTRAVAAALEHAHKQGVVHRDIKPENILLRDGDPLIADFGIALAVSHAGGNRLTETGLSLGTPHYMSPEQAMGDRELDARSDVYSLGAVLYEMLTGEPPYQGSTAQAIVARVITEEPRSITLQRRTVPPHVADAVHKALNKLPADRFGSAAEFADALTTPGLAAPSRTRSEQTAVATVRIPDWRRLFWPAAAFVLAVAALGGWLRPEARPAVAWYGLAFPPGQEPNDALNKSFALAPDGSWFVYDGPAESGFQLWIKARDAYDALALRGTAHGGGSAPAVSPDGEWIVFTADGQLRKVPRRGGSAITVADSVNMASGVAWLDDGTIVYRDERDRLRRVPDVGGASEIVWSRPEGESQIARLPNPLPGARAVLVGLCPLTGCVQQTVAVLDLGSGEVRELMSDASEAWYVATGHLVYVRPDGGVFAAPFDLRSLEVTGPSAPVLDGVQVSNGLVPDFVLSLSGSLLYMIGPAGGMTGTPVEAVWVGRDGTVTDADPDWEPTLAAGSYGWSLSPDGRRLAINMPGEGGDDVWIKELNGGPISRLTTAPGPDIRPKWRPDGQSVSFTSLQPGGNRDLYSRKADGTEPAEILLDLEEEIWEGHWSRDGSWLVVRVGVDGNRDLWVQRLGVDSTARRLLATDFDENAVALSPDGRWLAYQSDESGQLEVYVRPFPNIVAGKWPVSLDGGSRPMWSHSGRELFYADRGDRHMIAARIQTTPTFTVLERQELFPLDDYHLTTLAYTPWDLTADDQRFLMMRRASATDESARSRLVLVENWTEEVRKRMRRN